MIVASDAKKARLARGLAALVLALATGVVEAPPASAQSRAEREMARSLMDEGDAKVDVRDFAGALRAYRAAHAIMKVPTTGIEVARVEALRGHLIEAREVALAIQSIPPKPNGDPKPFVQAREEAQRLATDLEKRIPILTVVVRGVPEGAPLEVKLDGVLLPSEKALEPRPVNPGPHEVWASAGGLPPVSKQIEVAEGKRQTVILGLGGASDAEESSGKKIDEPARGGGLSPLVYVGFGVGGAGLIAGAITGILSLSRASAVEDLCPGGVCPSRQTLDQARPKNDAALTFANVSNVAFAVGVVGVGVGVTGLFLSKRESKKPAQGASLHLTFGPSSIGVAGSF